MATPPQSLPPELYLAFCAGIEQATAEKIVNSLTTASVNKVQRVHILFQTAGGYIGDGVFLYNFFRSIPVEVVLYNAGQISSAGVLAFLGAQKRIASKSATFMLHRGTNSPQFATSVKLQHLAKNLILDDARAEAILEDHVNLPDDLWTALQYHDLYLSGEEAVKYGLADEIGEFAPPLGTAVYNLIGG